MGLPHGLITLTYGGKFMRSYTIVALDLESQRTVIQHYQTLTAEDAVSAFWEDGYSDDSTPIIAVFAGTLVPERWA